jgi:hypothetical protein
MGNVNFFGVFGEPKVSPPVSFLGGDFGSFTALPKRHMFLKNAHINMLKSLKHSTDVFVIVLHVVTSFKENSSFQV